MDWFKGKSLTGNPHDLHGKIGLVSGFDFPKKTNPLTSWEPPKFSRAPSDFNHDCEAFLVAISCDECIGFLDKEKHDVGDTSHLVGG